MFPPANNFSFPERLNNVSLWLWKRFDITFYER